MSTDRDRREVTDAELIQAVIDHDDPVVKADDLAEVFPIGSTRINQLLNPLVEQGFLKSKRFGSGKGYWVPDRVD